MEVIEENPTKQELSDLIAMLSESFGYMPPDQISRDFPLLYEEKNINHLWVIKYSEGAAAGQITSHAGSLLLTLHSEGESIPVGGIGGVASLPAFRGKGFASRLVERCLADLREQGAALAFLWSDQHDFYRHLGFELIGRQWMVNLLFEKAALLHGESQRLALEKDESQSAFDFAADAKLAVREGKKLYDRHVLRIERSTEDYSLLLACDGAEVLTASKAGVLRAYLIIGKGIDLKNHIHEWAGDEEALLALLAHALKHVGEGLVFLSPQFTSEEAPILYKLERLGFAASPGFMALTKILNFAKIKKMVLAKMCALAMEPSLLRFEETGEDQYCLGWTTDPDLYMNGRELSRFIFGPDLPSTLVAELPESSRAAFDALFPCRLWWWGMDSV